MTKIVQNVTWVPSSISDTKGIAQKVTWVPPSISDTKGIGQKVTCMGASEDVCTLSCVFTPFDGNFTPFDYVSHLSIVFSHLQSCFHTF